jgi:hypothetical protein
MSEIHQDIGYSENKYKRYNFDNHLKEERDYDYKRRDYLLRKLDNLPEAKQQEITLKATKQAIERFKMFGRYKTSIEICLLEILENI